MDPVVLHIEDNKEMAELIAQLLKPYRCSIEWYEDGAEAYGTIVKNEREFELAIIDIHVPSMLGTDVVNLLRKSGTLFKQVAITSGRTDGESRIGEAMISGANIFLRKPEDYTHETFERLARWTGLEKSGQG